MNRTEALAKYDFAGMRLAIELESRWDTLLGMREPGTEYQTINALVPLIDRFRDAQSDLARATEQ